MAGGRPVTYLVSMAKNAFHRLINKASVSDDGYENEYFDDEYVEEEEYTADAEGFWKQGLFSNLWIWAGVGSMMLLQLAMTYLPVMNQLFGTAPIGLAEWLEITLVALLSSSVIALEKWLSNARRKL